LTHPGHRLPHVTPRKLALLRGVFGLAQMLSPALAAGRACNLFMRAYRRPLRPADAARLAQTTRRQLGQGEDAFIVHEWPGNGPTAIILHGWGSSAARFSQMAQVLQQQGWRVLVPDAPGHGASPGNSSSLPQFIASLDATVAQYGRPRALIGHSLGALAIACRHANGPPDWASGLKAVVLISMPASVEFLFDKFVAMLGLSAATEGLLRQRFQQRFHARPADFAALPGAGRIAAPILLLHDPADDIAPCAHSAGLFPQLPNAKFITTTGLGHSALTRDADTIRRIVEFIA
jgi:pimeloyl-ACP methyl ester carboxylesterase